MFPEEDAFDGWIAGAIFIVVVLSSFCALVFGTYREATRERREPATAAQIEYVTQCLAACNDLAVASFIQDCTSDGFLSVDEVQKIYKEYNDLKDKEKLSALKLKADATVQKELDKLRKELQRRDIVID